MHAYSFDELKFTKHMKQIDTFTTQICSTLRAFNSTVYVFLAHQTVKQNKSNTHTQTHKFTQTNFNVGTDEKIVNLLFLNVSLAVYKQILEHINVCMQLQCNEKEKKMTPPCSNFVYIHSHIHTLKEPLDDRLQHLVQFRVAGITLKRFVHFDIQHLFLQMSTPQWK